MKGRFCLNTLFRVRERDAKFDEIVAEIRRRFGRHTVLVSERVVSVSFDGLIELAAASRLEALVGRLGDYAMGAAIVRTIFNDERRTPQVIGSNPATIAMVRRIYETQLPSFDAIARQPKIAEDSVPKPATHRRPACLHA